MANKIYPRVQLVPKPSNRAAPVPRRSLDSWTHAAYLEWRGLAWRTAGVVHEGALGTKMHRSSSDGAPRQPAPGEVRLLRQTILTSRSPGGRGGPVPVSGQRVGRRMD